jgi:hypothetical protein
MINFYAILLAEPQGIYHRAIANLCGIYTSI